MRVSLVIYFAWYLENLSLLATALNRSFSFKCIRIRTKHIVRIQTECHQINFSNIDAYIIDRNVQLTFSHKIDHLSFSELLNFAVPFFFKLKRFVCVLGQVYDALKQSIVILFLNALSNHLSCQFLHLATLLKTYVVVTSLTFQKEVQLF